MAAEESAVRSWLSADPRREQELAAVRAGAGDTRWSAPEGLDVEAALVKVHARMRGPQVVVIGSRSGKRGAERTADPSAGVASPATWRPRSAHRASSSSCWRSMKSVILNKGTRESSHTLSGRPRSPAGWPG
jgi:hypothetical protein